MNDLIEGKPQRVQSGSLLLALSAWHLYPDISVQSTSLQFIKQADPLVEQGGIITVGLQSRTSHLEDGVHWSLPLARLGVYGGPMVKTRHNGICHTQITFSQLLCVTLGSLFGLWHILEADLDVAAEIMCWLARADEAFIREYNIPGHQRLATSGLGTLGRAAELYLSSKGSLHDEYARLLAYGRRRCSAFLLDKEDCPLPFFGLAKVPIAFTLFDPDITRPIRDRQVDFLRHWIYKRGIDLTGVIIWYKNSANLSTCTSVSEIRTGAKRKRSSAQIPIHQTDLHWSASGPESEEIIIGEESTGGGLSAAMETTSRFLAPGPEEQPIVHDLIYGDPSVAAIYRPSKIGYQTKIEDCYLQPKELLELLQDSSLSDSLLLDHIDKKNSLRFLRSLQALDFAGRIYEHLNDAKIDMQICLKGLHASHYARRLQVLDREKQKSSDKEMMTLTLAFSCIILFQTGRVDVDPEDLEGAMAISYSDSIFVAQRILVDPSHSDTVLSSSTHNWKRW